MTGADRARLPSGTVTFLLTDVEGSSRLWEANPADAGAAIGRHRDILAEAIERHGGVRPVEQGEGDSVVAAFERATDAVRAARDAQQTLGCDAWPAGVQMRVRMALHSGEAAPASDGTYAGAVLNRCARLRSLAHGGQVVVSQATRDLAIDHLDGDLDLRDLGTHRLRDLSRSERVWQVVGPGMMDDFPPLRSLNASPNNLPLQLSSFVGRDDDIALTASLLGETRLLTLTGSGGCGKTRLALRVGAEVGDRFPDGVWWVGLAAATGGELIAAEVAGAMGVRVPPDRDPLDVVVNQLAAHTVLVILDNCEHLIEPAARFADRVLRAGPDAKILATSREPLAVEGEVMWRVPSLDVPPETEVDPKNVGQYDAVRLFIERALQVRPNFAVTNANAPAVAEICHRLDGIPLAIELAAARTRAMAPDRIAVELGDRFRLLAGGTRTVMPRHQTLVASIDWSHDLLDADERAVFRRLGVFAGGFTLDAAEAVGAGAGIDLDYVLDVLARLVNKSLVQLDETSSPTVERYRLLESIRQYALDRLEEAGETAAVSHRHLEWAVSLAETLQSGTTNAHAEALDQLELEHANLRAAFDFGHAFDRVDDMLRLVAALGFFWIHRGHFAEARSWSAITDARSSGADVALVARARWVAAFAAFLGGDVTTAQVLIDAALTGARDCGDRATEARCLQTMGNAHLIDNPAACRVLASEAVEIAHETGDRWCEAHSLQLVAWSYLHEGRADEAEETLRLHPPVAEPLDNDIQRTWNQAALGIVALLRGRLDESDRHLQQALERVRRVGDPLVELVVCFWLAYRALASGHSAAGAAVAADLTEQDREWGMRGDAFIPAVVAMSRITDAPNDALATLAAVGEVLIAMGDRNNGSLVVLAGALAALEADDHEAGERLARLAISSARPVDMVATGPLDVVLGRAAMSRGDRSVAEEHGHKALAFMSERGLRTWLADTLELLGRSAIAAESWAEGCRLVAACDAFRTTIGQLRLPSAQREVETSIEAAHAALDVNFDAVWAEGQALSIDEAAAYARRARGERKRPSFGWDSLTPTELEVVRLVAQGLANPAIGERMFITSGTVKTHLRHVFAKLGVTSRAELAAEASRRHAAGP